MMYNREGEQGYQIQRESLASEREQHVKELPSKALLSYKIVMFSFCGLHMAAALSAIIVLAATVPISGKTVIIVLLSVLILIKLATMDTLRR